jgi:hypothetical protein
MIDNFDSIHPIVVNRIDFSIIIAVRVNQIAVKLSLVIVSNFVCVIAHLSAKI